MMKQASFSSVSAQLSNQARARSTIQVWAPADICGYKLRREEGESDASFEERKSFFNELLKLDGR